MSSGASDVERDTLYIVHSQEEVEVDADEVAVDEVLVEEVSIDGMCGVY